MIKTIFSRLGQGILVLFVLETITFFLVRQLPGHPFIGEKKLPAHILQRLEASYGLDQTALVQYGQYWKNILLHGDFGPSLVREGRSVQEIIGQAFPVSLGLGTAAMIIAILIGLSAGVLASLRQNHFWDWSLMILALLGICVPPFVIGPVLGMTLGMTVPGLSVAGWDSPTSWILPALTLGLVNAAYLARLTRGGMLEILSQDFIRTAQAKGASPARIVLKHALRGGLLPAISFIGPAFAAMISGSFVIETIFQVPGMGQHFVNATTERDYFLLQGLVLFYGILVVVANLLADICLACLNPRLRGQ